MSMGQEFYDDLNLQIYVVDSSDKRRLEETGIELYELLTDDKLQDVPLLVYANKQDLPESLTAADLAQTLGLPTIKDRAWQIQACCAVQGEGVREGMEWVCKSIKKK